MKFGYARVSKNEQSLDVQIQKLTEKQQGRKGGRPKVLTEEKADAIRALRQTGKMSVKKIYETMKVSRSVFYRCINQHVEV